MKIASDRLAGKVAIVTGIGSGIGRGCAELFARQGAQVMGCDLNVSAAEAVAAQARQAGMHIESVHPVDLTIPADVERVVQSTISRFGGIDIVVNAAAFAVFEFIEKMSFEDWRKTLAGELDVVFLMCKAVWPHLVARGGGCIVNFSSLSAYVAHPTSGALAHSAGKGGVLAMSRQLAVEGGPHGIRVNTIAPGLIVTGATAPYVEQPEFREKILELTMIKRLGQPTDIAWCASFLVSDEASWITAADFSVDGGAGGR